MKKRMALGGFRYRNGRSSAFVAERELLGGAVRVRPGLLHDGVLQQSLLGRPI